MHHHIVFYTIFKTILTHTFCRIKRKIPFSVRTILNVIIISFEIIKKKKSFFP